MFTGAGLREASGGGAPGIAKTGFAVASPGKLEALQVQKKDRQVLFVKFCRNFIPRILFERLAFMARRHTLNKVLCAKRRDTARRFMRV